MNTVNEVPEQQHDKLVDFLFLAEYGELWKEIECAWIFIWHEQYMESFYKDVTHCETCKGKFRNGEDVVYLRCMHVHHRYCASLAKNQNMTCKK